jgi:endonuclease III
MAFPYGNKANPLHELLFLLCSVQTNDARDQSTYASLSSRFPALRQLADASVDNIAAAIARGGLARQKARTIRDSLAPAIRLRGPDAFAAAGNGRC